MKPDLLPPGYIALAAVVSISLLEGLNLVTTGHNGTVLECALVCVAGLGGWGSHVLYRTVVEKREREGEERTLTTAGKEACVKESKSPSESENKSSELTGSATRPESENKSTSEMSGSKSESKVSKSNTKESPSEPSEPKTSSPDSQSQSKKTTR